MRKQKRIRFAGTGFSFFFLHFLRSSPIMEFGMEEKGTSANIFCKRKAFFRERTKPERKAPERKNGRIEKKREEARRADR